MLELLLGTLLGILTFLNLSLILLTVYDPQQPPFWGYLVPNKYFILPVRLAVCVYHISNIFYLCHGLSLSCSLLIIYNFFIPYILGKEMRVGRRKSCYKADDEIRKADNLRLVFRGFQVLHYNFICFVGLFLALINAGCMVTAMYALFVLINYGKDLQVLTAIPLLIAVVLIMVIWSAVLEYGKIYHVMCKKVFFSWKRYNWGSRKENQIMAKFRVSCRPILMSYGKDFVVGPLSVLNFSKGVMRGTMRVLLSAKH